MAAWTGFYGVRPLRLARFFEQAASPWVDLAVRLWFAQLFWTSGIVGVVGDAHGWSMRPAALGLANIVFAPLLAAGFATRLICLPLLWLCVLGAEAMPGQDASILWAMLAAWFVIAGPGPVSLDALLARGIFDSALPLARPAGRALMFLTRYGRALMLCAIRVALAFVLLRHGMMASGILLAVPALLATGLATRLAVLPLLAAAGAATMHTVSNEHLGWMLLLLLILVHGPGALSLDTLLGAVARRLWPAMRSQRGAAGPRVVIVGGGFAGIEAARGLRHGDCDIVLIDQTNHHLFQPLLYQVATAGLSPADIATPIRALFRDQPNASVRLARVDGVDTAAQHVSLEDGARLPYDMLVLATGARHGYFGRDAWEAHAPGLKTVDDAVAIRRRLLLAFERAEAASDENERRALLTFAVIGGGPTGVELAGAIAELAHHGLAGEFRAIDPAQARVLLVQAGDRLLPTFPPALSAAALTSLQSLGVEVRLGPAVDDVDEDGILLAGERIACRTAFWAAGVMASPAAIWLGAAADRAGRVIVSADLSVPGLESVFVIGDTASANAWNGAAVPGLAPAAKQAGAYVASVIEARLTARPAPAPFRYRHAGNLATVGRRAAVADFGRVRIAGAAAWWLWGAVHVLFLAGARNRLAVSVQWVWAYLTYGRGIRLITGEGAR